MPKPDLAPFAARVVAAVKSYVAKAEAGLTARVDALQARLEAMPAPERGEKGETGPAGKDADVGAVAALVEPRVTAELEKRLAALPQAKDGAPGRDGQPGAPGPAGRDGEDGRDGFSPEDFELSLDGRVLKLALVRGEARIEREVKLAFPIYRDVYRPSEKYEKADCVTFGGHVWIATVDEPTDKPGTSEQWRLAVKRGRDGKDKQ